MTKVISLSKAIVNATDLTKLTHYMEFHAQQKQYFLEEAGKEPYKLYAYLSQHVHGDIIDAGTLFGTSALALSANEQNTVFTFDTVKYIPDNFDKTTPLNRPNVKSYICHAQAVMPKIAQAEMVLLDIDPHIDGEAETQFVELLVKHKFRGILVADDINLNEGMQNFWNNIPSHLKKLNVSPLGHWSGTGVIVFDPSYIDIVVNDE